MRTLLWLVWDILTHRTYRVKIITYATYDDTTHYVPQVRYSIFPIMWWRITTDAYFGTQAKFFDEYYAWEFIRTELARLKVGRPIEVKFKYEE